jgi:hypothetical protein
VREFFCSGYPAMQSIQHNFAVAKHAGYGVLTTYTLPKDAWVKGYYGLLEPCAKALIDHPDPSVLPQLQERQQEGGENLSRQTEPLKAHAA